MGLIEKLKQRQGERSQVEFAAELGISQPQLSRIYSGDRRLSVEIAKRIRERYPELAFDLAEFLLSGDIQKGSGQAQLSVTSSK